MDAMDAMDAMYAMDAMNALDAMDAMAYMDAMDAMDAMDVTVPMDVMDAMNAMLCSFPVGKASRDCSRQACKGSNEESGEESALVGIPRSCMREVSSASVPNIQKVKFYDVIYGTKTCKLCCHSS
jgi:hypothetical protein